MNDLDAIVQSARNLLRSESGLDVHTVVDREIARAAPLLDPVSIRAARRSVLADLVGMGPLERWLDDPQVTEVMVNAGRDVWIDRVGVPERVDRLPPGQLDGLIERIIAPLGLRLDRTSPIVDARLADGSRLCAVVPPLAPDGPCCSIRRFRVRDLALTDLAAAGPAELLGELVDVRCNVVVCGATSSGKTTLLNALAARIPPGDRLVTIEDTAELRLAADHVVRLEARPASSDGPGAVGIRELVRAALRLRPDRLVVGEVRGAEALDMVQALNTGHDGSLTTCHANGPLDAVRRLEAMVSMAAPSWPTNVVREQVHGSVDAIVHLARQRNGVRRVVGIAEVTPPDRLHESGRITMLADSDRVIGPLTRRRT